MSVVTKECLTGQAAGFCSLGAEVDVSFNGHP